MVYEENDPSLGEFQNERKNNQYNLLNNKRNNYGQRCFRGNQSQTGRS